MIFIAGIAGNLGKSIAKELEILKINYSGCDIIDNNNYKCDINSDKFKSIIKKIKPTIIINCIAKIDVKACEDDYKEAYKANCLSVINIIEACKIYNSKLIHISTTYLYNGKKELYNEDDNYSPINNYSFTKVNAEKLINHFYINNSIIIRTNFLNKNQKFISFTIDNINNNKTEYYYNNIYQNYISVNDLCNIIIKLTKINKLIGTYNIVCQEKISKYELAKIIQKMMNNTNDIILQKEYDDYINRPLNLVMDITKFQKVCYENRMRIPSFKDTFKKIME